MQKFKVAKLTRTKLTRNKWSVSDGTNSVVVVRCGPMWEVTNSFSKLVGFGATINEAAQQALDEMARPTVPCAWLGGPARTRARKARTSKAKVRRTVTVGGDRDDSWLDDWYLDSDDWRVIKW